MEFSGADERAADITHSNQLMKQRHSQINSIDFFFKFNQFHLFLHLLHSLSAAEDKIKEDIITVIGRYILLVTILKLLTIITVIILILINLSNQNHQSTNKTKLF